jgi:hypothetical protein
VRFLGGERDFSLLLSVQIDPAALTDPYTCYESDGGIEPLTNVCDYLPDNTVSRSTTAL